MTEVKPYVKYKFLMNRFRPNTYMIDYGARDFSFSLYCLRRGMNKVLAVEPDKDYNSQWYRTTRFTRGYFLLGQGNKKDFIKKGDTKVLVDGDDFPTISIDKMFELVDLLGFNRNRNFRLFKFTPYTVEELEILLTYDKIKVWEIIIELDSLLYKNRVLLYLRKHFRDFTYFKSIDGKHIFKGLNILGGKYYPGGEYGNHNY